MNLDHCGLFNRSAEEAERFYTGLLGLTKEKDSVLPRELASRFFSLDSEVRMLVFSGGTVKIEVFVYAECAHPNPSFTHIGIDIDDIDALLKTAAEHDVTHLSAQTGEKTIHFLTDFSGNLIEIRQA